MTPEELQDIIDKYPIVAQFADWKRRMAAALKSHGAADVSDMHDYPNIIRDKFAFSIDKAIHENNIDDIFIDKTLGDIIVESMTASNAVIKDIYETKGSYYTKCCYENIDLIDAPKMPNDCVGNLASAFYNCHNLKHAHIGSLKNVTDITYLFYQCCNLESIEISPDEYPADLEAQYGPCKGAFVDCRNMTNVSQWLQMMTYPKSYKTLPFEECTVYAPKLTNWGINGLTFGKKIHLLDFKPTSWGQGLLHVNTNTREARVEEITGVDCRKISYSTGGAANWGNRGLVVPGNTAIKHLGFVPNNYHITRFDVDVNCESLNIDDIAIVINNAYDWKTNPDNKTFPTSDRYTWTGTAGYSMQFHFETTDKTKQRLTQAGYSLTDMEQTLAQKSAGIVQWTL